MLHHGICLHGGTCFRKDRLRKLNFIFGLWPMHSGMTFLPGQRIYFNSWTYKTSGSYGQVILTPIRNFFLSILPRWHEHKVAFRFSKSSINLVLIYHARLGRFILPERKQSDCSAKVLLSSGLLFRFYFQFIIEIQQEEHAQLHKKGSPVSISHQGSGS